MAGTVVGGLARTGLHRYVGAGARVAPVRAYRYFLSGTFLVVQPVHLHQHTGSAPARKSANMVSAIMVSILPMAACECMSVCVCVYLRVSSRIVDSHCVTSMMPWLNCGINVTPCLRAASNASYVTECLVQLISCFNWATIRCNHTADHIPHIIRRGMYGCFPIQDSAINNRESGHTRIKMSRWSLEVSKQISYDIWNACSGARGSDVSNIKLLHENMTIDSGVHKGGV